MITMSCREAADFTSRELDGSLTPGMRDRLGQHRSVCSSCRRYLAQLQFVSKAARSRLHLEVMDQAQLAAESKDRMKVLVQQWRKG
jgi:hypothetical protein